MSIKCNNCGAIDSAGETRKGQACIACNNGFFTSYQPDLKQGAVWLEQKILDWIQEENNYRGMLYEHDLAEKIAVLIAELE